MKLIKQTIYNLRQQPVIASVTIIGTALSIFLIMVVVMLHQVNVMPFSPESNRDRFLHYTYLSFGNTSWSDDIENNNSNGPMSWKVVNELFYKLEEPEAVTAYTVSAQVNSVGLPKQKPFAADTRETDANYFKVFDFKFVSGAPYSEAEFEAGLPRAVIDENVANRLFGTTDAVGKEFVLNGGSYKVSGVVKPVSTLAKQAYAHVWVNTTSANGPESDWATLGGMYSVTILPKDEPGAEAAVRDEFGRRLDEYNKEIGQAGWKIINRNRPYTQEKLSAGNSANIEPDEKAARKQRVIIFAILLIVPAINLSSMTHSRLRRRVSEIAVRRAFGQTRFATIMSVINENLVITCVAGVIGLALSVVMALLFGEMLFSQGWDFSLSRPKVDFTMLFSWSTFGWAVLFCFVLNLLSSGIPAIQASRQPLVNSLRGGSNK